MARREITAATVVGLVSIGALVLVNIAPTPE
jgi:hypothetical protein